MRFAELFESAANRAEVICTFLALLELIRLKQLVCTQPEPFAEIEIRRATVPPVATAPANNESQTFKVAGSRRLNRKSQIANLTWN